MAAGSSTHTVAVVIGKWKVGGGQRKVAEISVPEVHLCLHAARPTHEFV